MNGVTTEYFLSGSTILAEKTGNSITWFLYDMEGNRVGYEYNGATYWYVTNIQGDVMYVVDSSGTPIGKYDYSHWGDCTATLLVESASSAFAANSFTYRGYYYDDDVGLYYLQSRYYDAEVGRFINSDGYASTGQGFTGNNMYAYCNNDPLLYRDDTGTRAVLYREVDGMTTPMPKAPTPKEQTKGLINGQKYLSYADEFIDLGTYGDSGCVHVAVYNAMQLLNKPQSMAQVSSDIMGVCNPVLGGLLGVRPKSISNYFALHGVAYSASRNPSELSNGVQDGSVLIFTFWNKKGNIFEGWHCMAAQYRNGQYVVYNRFSSFKKNPGVRPYDSIEEVNSDGKFIYGLRIDP